MPGWVATTRIAFAMSPSLRTERIGIAGNHQLLIGSDDPHWFAARGGDVAFLAAEGFVVLLRVELEAEIFKQGDGFFAHQRGIFADTTGEDDGIGATEADHLCGDVLGEAVAIDIHRANRRFIALGVGFFHGAAVVGHAGQTKQAGLFPQHVIHFFRAHAHLPGKDAEDGGIDIAGTGAVHHAFQRGQTHRGVHGMVEIHSGDGGTVTEVGDDGFRLGDAEFFRQLAGDVAVRGAVETVTADFVVGVEFVRQRVEEGALRHMLVEGGIEDDDLFQVGEGLAGGVNTGDVRRVV